MINIVEKVQKKILKCIQRTTRNALLSEPHGVPNDTKYANVAWFLERFDMLCDSLPCDSLNGSITTLFWHLFISYIHTSAPSRC